jgi:hypothetical protein
MNMPAMASAAVAWALSGVLHMVAGGYIMYRWPQLGDKVEAAFGYVLGKLRK